MVGRFLMYATIAALAVFVLSSYVLLQHGGGSIAAVQTVSIQDLTSGSRSFENKPVTTEGVLSYSNEHGEYQIVENEFAVIIKDQDTNNDPVEFDGERVRVSGTFRTSDELGAYIDAHAIERTTP